MTENTTITPQPTVVCRVFFSTDFQDAAWCIADHLENRTPTTAPRMLTAQDLLGLGHPKFDSLSRRRLFYLLFGVPPSQVSHIRLQKWHQRFKQKSVGRYLLRYQLVDSNSVKIWSRLLGMAVHAELADRSCG